MFGNKELFIIIVAVFVIVFISAIPAKEEKPKLNLKASDFNEAIHARDKGDDRAIYYDKQTVRNIIERGCYPVIPENNNQNIQEVC